MKKIEKMSGAERERQAEKEKERERKEVAKRVKEADGKDKKKDEKILRKFPCDVEKCKAAIVKEDKAHKKLLVKLKSKVNQVF